MNFQAVSVGQKVTADGYTDATGTPSAQLEQSLDFVDNSLGQMLTQLDNQHLTQNTLVIVGAKHGQSPIDVSQLHMLKGSTNPRLLPGHADVVDPVDLLTAGGIKVEHETADDVSLNWLADQTQAKQAVTILKNDQALLNQAPIEKIYAAGEPKETFGDPALGRTPDIIIQPIHGTIYSKSAAKVSEHGGFTDDDTHVLLVAANPSFEAGAVDDMVENKQVAPTILRALGLDPDKLVGARAEHTQASARFRPLRQTSDKTADRDLKSKAPGSIRAPFSYVLYSRCVAPPRPVVVWRAQRLVSRLPARPRSRSGKLLDKKSPIQGNHAW